MKFLTKFRRPVQISKDDIEAALQKVLDSRIEESWSKTYIQHELNKRMDWTIREFVENYFNRHLKTKVEEEVQKAVNERSLEISKSFGDGTFAKEVLKEGVRRMMGVAGDDRHTRGGAQ